MSLILQFNLLLQANEHIFITVDFFFKFLLASLSFLNLQMKRLDIPLDLLDALDYFLLEDFLAVFDI